MLIHPKAGFNVRDCYCSRCGRNHHDRIAMGANDFVDTCPKCGAMYYGGNDKNACVKCGEHYTANAAYCRAIWKRRYVPKTERVPAKGPCQICVDFILAVEEAAKAGGIGVRCKSCRSEHVIGGETQFAKKVREQLKIEAPAVAFAILTKCFNCASEEQQKSLGLIEEAKAEEHAAQSGVLGDGVPIKHLGADQVPNEEEEAAHTDLTNLRETLVRMRNAVRDEGEEGKVEV